MYIHFYRISSLIVLIALFSRLFILNLWRTLSRLSWFYKLFWFVVYLSRPRKPSQDSNWLQACHPSTALASSACSSTVDHQRPWFPRHRGLPTEVHATCSPQRVSRSTDWYYWCTWRRGFGCLCLFEAFAGTSAWAGMGPYQSRSLRRSTRPILIVIYMCSTHWYWIPIENIEVRLPLSMSTIVDGFIAGILAIASLGGLVPALVNIPLL